MTSVARMLRYARSQGTSLLDFVRNTGMFAPGEGGHCWETFQGMPVDPSPLRDAWPLLFTIYCPRCEVRQELVVEIDAEELVTAGSPREALATAYETVAMALADFRASPHGRAIYECEAAKQLRQVNEVMTA